MFAGNLGVYHQTQNPHNGDDVGFTQCFAGGDVRLVIHCETLELPVPIDVCKDGVMEGNLHVVDAGAYLQDIVVGFRHYAPRTADPIPVSPPGDSGSSRKSTDSHLVTVDLISAGKKCGSVRYPLVLVGNLNGVLKRTSFYQAVKESSPRLLQLSSSAMIVVPLVSPLLHWRTSLAR